MRQDGGNHANSFLVHPDHEETGPFGPFLGHGNGPFYVFHRLQRRPGGYLAHYRDALHRGERPKNLDSPGFRGAGQASFLLQCPQMVDRRAVIDPEVPGNLSHRGRIPLVRGKALDEIQNLPLPRRNLHLLTSHSLFSPFVFNILII